MSLRRASAADHGGNSRAQAAKPARRKRESSPAEHALEMRLGYRFRDPDRLRQALTHRSWSHEHGSGARLVDRPLQAGRAPSAALERDNERLEFLGDAVLGVRVSERLLSRFPSSSEGQLSEVRSWMVSARNLASVAERLELGAALRLSHAEEAIGGRANPRLLANAMEAVIAAIHLDGGYRAAAQFIDRHILDSGLDRLAPGALHEFAYKSALQEWAHAAGQRTPAYRVLAVSGPDHERTFTVRVELKDGTFADATGASKKSAEQRAAALALEHLGVVPAGGHAAPAQAGCGHRAGE